MSEGLIRTFSFLALIVIGLLLKSKVPSNQRSGIKQIILSLALPAVIFISLQKVEFSLGMILFPVLALMLNVLMFTVSGWLTRAIGVNPQSPVGRTAQLLIPSLAPGLSCFPFILEFLGEEALANAAFADVGNKLFVLVILYAVAMRWYYQLNNIEGESSASKLKKFGLIMIKEPVNLAIIAALTLVGFGVNYSIFPEFLQLSIDKLGMIMTPLIMIFIGLSVKLTWGHARLIFGLLAWRSAIAFLLSGLVIILFKIADPALIMLAILFPQSSASFWPYLHIESVSVLESNVEGDHKTFEPTFALNFLAMSLPFSTIMILALATFKEQVASATVSFSAGGILIGFLLIGSLVTSLKGANSIKDLVKSDSTS
ncbi:AEC family transporter [Marinoscillum pacificum]|uniref:AEC family transporter n=1 Tax=Marinoscillum pacificum TaxID=392723 RepID=UPI0021583AAE|nr:permease [Marinoscillum pacificum]